jgi:twitching motility protein PilJ
MSKETGSVWSTVFGNPRAGFFTAMLIVSILAFLGVTIFVNTQANQDKEYIGHSGELRVLSQELAKNAVEAAGGKAEAFSLLRNARDNFQVRWGYLNEGNAETGLYKPKILFFRYTKLLQP